MTGAAGELPLENTRFCGTLIHAMGEFAMSDSNYFQLRARREREAALRQQHPAARHAHLVMAERYERLIAEGAAQPR